MSRWRIRERYGSGARRLLLRAEPPRHGSARFGLAAGIVGWWHDARREGLGRSLVRGVVPFAAAAWVLVALALVLSHVPRTNEAERAHAPVEIVLEAPRASVPPPALRERSEPPRVTRSARRTPEPVTAPAPVITPPAPQLPELAVATPRAFASHAPTRTPRAPAPSVSVAAPPSRPEPAPFVAAGPPTPERALPRAGRERPAPSLRPPSAPLPSTEAPRVPAIRRSPDSSVERPSASLPRPSIRSVAAPNARPAHENSNVHGVPLGSLAACRTDEREDQLKRRVIASVEAQVSCKSDAGTYRFVETKNLNAFLLWIERSPHRVEANRCSELELALECLAAQRSKESRES